MKLRNKVLTAITASIIASSAMATQIDFRHEYKVESEKHASRIKLGHGWKIADDWKGNVGLEMKFASDEAEDFFNDVVLTETELDLGLTYKLNKQWQIKPGMPISLKDDRTTFKPQLRVVYKSSFGLTTGLRYRYEIASFVKGDGEKDLDTNELDRSTYKSKVTLTGSYKVKSMPNLKLNYEANYEKSHSNVKKFDGDDHNYDFGAIVGYQLGAWRPYAELWNSSVSSSTDERQAKLRVGLKYKF